VKTSLVDGIVIVAGVLAFSIIQGKIDQLRAEAFQAGFNAAVIESHTALEQFVEDKVVEYYDSLAGCKPLDMGCL